MTAPTPPGALVGWLIPAERGPSDPAMVLLWCVIAVAVCALVVYVEQAFAHWKDRRQKQGV